MNEPIISPWLIYLIDIARPVTAVAFVFGALSLLASAACFIAIADLTDDAEKVASFGTSKKLFIAGCTFALIWVLIPSQSTIYKMIAASYVTPANIQTAGELADKAVDKVIDKIADAIQKFERSEKK